MSTSKLNEPVIMTYKSRTASDAGAYYAPYTPLQVTVPIKWERIGIDGPANKWVYSIRSEEIRIWIEEQPFHMWKHYDIPEESIKDIYFSALLGWHYIFTEEMEAWFALRWS